VTLPVKYQIRPFPNYWHYIPASNTSLALTFFSTIYLPRELYNKLTSPNPDLFSKSVLLHERTHLLELYEYGSLKWYLRYLLSRQFRFSAELRAIEVQMNYLAAHGGNYDLEWKADQLSNSTYVWAAAYTEAKSTLTKMWEDAKKHPPTDTRALDAEVQMMLGKIVPAQGTASPLHFS